MLDPRQTSEQAARFGRRNDVFDQRCREVSHQYAEAYRAYLRGDDIDHEAWAEWHSGWVEYLMYLGENSVVGYD